MSNPLQSEPVVTVGAVMALVYLAVAFGAPISEDQQRVMKEQLPLLLPLFVAGVAWMRALVTPTAKVDATVEERVQEVIAASVR